MSQPATPDSVSPTGVPEPRTTPASVLSALLQQLPAELIGIVEGLHLGSLIIDDIEDESSTRRGGPTLHRQIGVPNALNAGNWLYFWPALLVPRLKLGPDREL